jgi:hypothetical protein
MQLLFVPYFCNNTYILSHISSGHICVTVQTWTHVYAKFIDQKAYQIIYINAHKVMNHPV